MTPEHGEVPDSDDTPHPRPIPLLQVHQHFHFDIGLPQQLTALPHNLQRLHLSPLMVIHPQDLPKRPLVYKRQHLVTISDMVADLILVELAGCGREYPYYGEGVGCY